MRAPAAARVFPSGEKATKQAAASKRCSLFPVSTSHTYTLAAPDASIVPSGEKSIVVRRGPSMGFSRLKIQHYWQKKPRTAEFRLSYTLVFDQLARDACRVEEYLLERPRHGR